MSEVILIGGPTASGKSTLALALARHLGSPIINADSRQLYRGMDIGTAKPTPEEQALAPHYLLDVADPDEGFSAGRFEAEALALIARLGSPQHPIIVVGGTGLYLEALYRGLDHFPPVPDALLSEIRETYQSRGLGALQEWLRTVDPDYALQVDMANPHRLMRAIAVTLSAGTPYSTLRRRTPTPRPFPMTALYLDAPREWLYPRIDQRVMEMMEAGLLDEARRLLPYRDLPSLQTVGYPELFAYLDGHLSLEEAVALIQRHTRQYAKRQMTWFRRREGWQALSALPEATLTDRALALLSAPAD